MVATKFALAGHHGEIHNLPVAGAGNDFFPGRATNALYRRASLLGVSSNDDPVVPLRPSFRERTYGR